MALSIAEADAVSTKYFDKTITQQVYEKSPFFATLKADKQIITDGGTSMQWPVRTSKLNNAKSTGPRNRVDFKSKETRTGADIDWVYYDTTNVIHWDERVQNNGKEKIINLLKDKADEALEDIREILYQAIFATDGVSGTDLETLDRIIDAADDYGGIAVSDAAAWAGVEDSSTTTLKLYGSGSLSTARNSATFGTDMPTLHITTRDLFSKYESLLQPQLRYEDKKMANLGFTNLTFNTRPVVSDVFCPDNYWFGIDLKCIELRVHTDNNLDVGPWFKMEQAGYPKAMGKYICWVGNLLARRRRTSFKFSALIATN